MWVGECIMCGGEQGRLHLKRAGGGANFLERALYQVITHKGRGVGTNGGQLKTTDFLAKMPTFNASCVIIRFQLQMALQKYSKGLIKMHNAPNAPL